METVVSQIKDKSLRKKCLNVTNSLHSIQEAKAILKYNQEEITMTEQLSQEEKYQPPLQLN